MNIPLSREAHIAIRYAILHAYQGKINPGTTDYNIQRAAHCFVCKSEGTPYGVETTHLREMDPGDHMFHHVCSQCFSQQVLCTDYVTFNIINIAYMNTSTGQIEFFCTESRYEDGITYHVEGQPCDQQTFERYVAKMKENALMHRERCIADSQRFFNLDDGSEATPHFPAN